MRFQILFFFFFNDTATTEIYTLSLHDALPICFLVMVTEPGAESTQSVVPASFKFLYPIEGDCEASPAALSKRFAIPFNWIDRKSTRLNSSHTVISYAVFCLKKKIKENPISSDS